ncbi:MAG: hypothetical protein OEU92_19075 [Alphaproteobacteria bacterium]|nr:hypothetical protein [Alphaproteobacteria bacterium]
MKAQIVWTCFDAHQDRANRLGVGKGVIEIKIALMQRRGICRDVATG